MSRLKQEATLVPAVARWAAAFVGLAYAGLMASLFLVPVAMEEPRSLVYVSPVFLLSLIGGVPFVIDILLVGYVWGDARRRRMSHVVWTLLALFIPGAVGIILYFILRDPLPIPCPSCGTLATKGHAFCSACGAAVCAACPRCRQPVEPGWRNCTSCGASLRPEASPATPAS